jgi:trans-aconitate methyltransferase
VSAAAPHWDAELYERNSDPQLTWGLEVIDRLTLRGDETVLDAGCGSGGLTRALVERLPRGRVVAVDGAPSMVERARATLGDAAEVRLADLAELDLREPVDAVFSNAVFHWIPDRERLFTRLFAALRAGGRLEAQCGGRGNNARFGRVAAGVSSEAPFAPHLEGRGSPWRFDDAETAADALREAGFEEVEAWLEERDVDPADGRGFLRGSCLPPFLERLPEGLHEQFTDRLVAELGEPLHLDYVRLNLSARRPLRLRGDDTLRTPGMHDVSHGSRGGASCRPLSTAMTHTGERASK